MDNNLDPPSNLKPSSVPLLPSFMCPIGHEIMHDPVSCADSHSYEQAHIERWLVSNSMSPLTGAVLLTKVVTSNHALRNLIQERQEESRCVVEVDENTPPPLAAPFHPMCSRNGESPEAVVVERRSTRLSLNLTTTTTIL